ncbi:MAG: NADH-quinone oxidoreductase subunit L [Bacteriovoracaceae bacterium]
MTYGFAISNAWLIPLLPFLSFLITSLFLRRISESLAGTFATISVMFSMVLAYMVAFEYFTLYPIGTNHPVIIPIRFEWMTFQENLAMYAGVLLDPISIMLMTVVTTVSSLVHLYSNGYLHGEKGFGRYFGFLNLFTFSMLGLVVAPNILQTFIFWELVGVSSFLLIGHYFEKPSAVSASKKAFIVTRFADLGFLLGIILLGYYGYQTFSEFEPAITAASSQYFAGNLQALDYYYLTNIAVAQKLHSIDSGIFNLSILSLSMLLIFMGAAGKSAMFPLHIWLPDAMEGPTPVSALIHAATMVVAGVYLVARLFTAYATASDVLTFIAYVGAFTSIFAAIIGCTQNDIKRVLAFSTLSQLGYMMFALGVATLSSPLGFTASMFHLYTHAFFKALLFLGAGSLIHAVHSNSIWDMGGLAKKMPITHITFLIACLAIAGVYPFAGFFSKDEILLAAHENGFTGIYYLGLIVAGLTAFYMFRIYFVSFWGKKSEHSDHAHESPFIMTLPLMLLAVLSCVVGFVPMNDVLGLKIEHGAHHGINFAIAVPATIMGLIGIILAGFFYAGSSDRVTKIKNSLAPIHKIIQNKFYIDEIYLFITHKIIFKFIAAPIAWFDRTIVDGAVNVSGEATRRLGSRFGKFQTGQVQTYGLWLVSGVIILFFVLWAFTI